MWRAIGILLLCLVSNADVAAANERLRELLANLIAAHQSRNQAEIFHWTLQVAAQSKDPYYRARVGDLLWHGRGVSANPEHAVAWYRSAAARGSGLGMIGLARAHFQGRGAMRDVDVAMHWLAEAADRGMTWAHFELASHHLFGAATLADAARAEDRIARGLEKSAADARRSTLDRRAKANPIGAAYLAAGDAFACPIAAPQNLRMALQYWVHAASEGYAQGWDRLTRLARHAILRGKFCDSWR